MNERKFFNVLKYIDISMRKNCQIGYLMGVFSCRFLESHKPKKMIYKYRFIAVLSVLKMCHHLSAMEYGIFK